MQYKKGSKRYENLKKKVASKAAILFKYKTADEARTNLTNFFPDKYSKYFEILLARFYGGATLQQLGNELKVTREYIRQCQERALDILHKHLGTAQ